MDWINSKQVKIISISIESVQRVENSFHVFIKIFWIFFVTVRLLAKRRSERESKVLEPMSSKHKKVSLVSFTYLHFIDYSSVNTQFQSSSFFRKGPMDQKQPRIFNDFSIIFSNYQGKVKFNSILFNLVLKRARLRKYTWQYQEAMESFEKIDEIEHVLLDDLLFYFSYFS